jgi:tRNA threonylcarbamoyladenosine biosynthesis protein TsaE
MMPDEVLPEPGAGSILRLNDESETEQLGHRLASQALAALEAGAAGVVFGLVGPLGAGKTRLTRAIAESLGVDPAAISSPTFTLIHEYPGQVPVFHFDVYRLRSAAEFEDLGAADYWSAGGVCLVEWADRVSDLLPADATWIRLEPAPERGPTARLAHLGAGPSGHRGSAPSGS